MKQNEITKLDAFVKDSLNQYQVSYDAAHWNEFEQQLQKGTSNGLFKKFTFSLNTLIGIGMMGAIALSAIWILNSKETTQSIPENNSNTVVTSPTNTINNTTVSNNPQKQENTTTKITSPQNTLNNTVHDVFTEPKKFVVTSKNPLFRERSSEAGINEEKRILEKRNANMLINGGNNGKTLFFPDMIDPKRGAIFTTEENDAIKSRALNDYNSSTFYKTNDDGSKVLLKDSVKQFFENTKEAESILKAGNPK